MAERTAPYTHFKFAAVQLVSDVSSSNRWLIDVDALSNAELVQLDSLLANAGKPVEDGAVNGQRPVIGGEVSARDS